MRIEINPERLTSKTKVYNFMNEVLKMPEYYSKNLDSLYDCLTEVEEDTTFVFTREKLKEVFPSIKLYEKSHDAIQINFDSVWWNAEYKEPTTKNDLAVDCISRADAIQAMQDKAKKLTNEDTINGLCGAVAILFDLPSVTPQEPRWIPVSERLPKTDNEISINKYNVLLWIKNRL